ncbi:MAG: hypothetical protein V1790_05995 [Planctomycetota bacterium]
MATAGRTTRGTFAVGCRGGPGRLRKGSLERAYKSARGDAVRDALQAIANELDDAESKIAAADEELAEAEGAYLESIAPILNERSRAAVAYSRSKAAQTFLESGELDRADVWEAAGRRHAEAVAALEAAEAALVRSPCPPGDRRQLILDRDAWTRVQEHETARDAQQAAERELNESEIECRSLGLPVDVAPAQTNEGARRRGGHKTMGDI